MIARPAAVLLAPLLFALHGLAAADVPIGDISLGTSVAALARLLGSPQDVVSDDAGNRFGFAGGTAAYTDDDGTVLAVDTQSGSPQVEIDGRVRAFPIGSYSLGRADAELAGVAEFATGTIRSYRIAVRRDLVLRFGHSSNRLERLTYGEPGQLVRLGLLPGDPAAKAVNYRAPRPKLPPPPTPQGRSTTVFRIAIDRAGGVSEIAVLIASEQPENDAARAAGLRAQRYTPATLDGRPIAATIFLQIRP